MTRYDFDRSTPVARVAGLVASFGPRPYVEVDGDAVRVRMGLSFRADIARDRVAEVTRDEGRISRVGVHGWAGSWLVNTSRRGIVRLTIDPAGRALALGVPVKLRVLELSLADPDAFVAELQR